MGQMKKWFLALSIITLLIFAGVFYWKKPIFQPKPNKVLSAVEAPTTAPTPHAWKQSTVINFDGVPIRISWAIVQPKDVKLYSNLKEQHLSEQIKVDKSCSVLVNGGFYSEENTHLGLFVSNFEVISKFSQSATRNGFLWIDSSDNVKIGADFPSTIPRLGLQSGPLLKLNREPLALAIKNDEPKRRIVAGVALDNNLIFLVFYRDSAEYEGPMLEKLPEIIDLFKKQTGIDIVDAVNLDGGSASVFVSNYDSLRELTIVGSYFCAK
ncbi:MAG: hypothetical protein UU14_C0031G0003 [Candidatus Roizmanbacteria bacterium GW2011_GWB1_40_7]|uniref:Phosphodiester glycosidase domain-containing protein n=1 Tax=Candidatus Roizmanbacteria bacterium GW2011_GWB1_40_7 TaxID=1618482 RepID=A0A0G0T934_9BACT|nr:MAG: hypothetical protein UU14_C0031G0003 [Candidatus Roizmanbacteria bacterium GW2011_GWB1_40_7]